MENFELKPEQFMLMVELVSAVLGDESLEENYQWFKDDGYDDDSDELITHPYRIALRFAKTIELMGGE